MLQLNNIKKIFPAGLLLIIPAFISGQGILNTSGTNLVANGTAKIVLNNAGFTNNGIFSAGNSDMIFTGNTSTANSFIAGSAGTEFYNLVLNKSVNGLQLNRSVAVSNSVVFNSGDSLFLNNNILDLGSTGNLTGETENKRVTGRTGGYIQVTPLLNAPTDINPGNLGFKVTSTANLGNTIIKRGHQQQSGRSIYRYYDVTPLNNSGLAATVNLCFFDAELAGLSEANLAIFYSSNGGTAWTNLGENGIDQSLNYVTVNNIDVLNRFTLSHISQPLAVKLLSFKAALMNGQTLLDWSTANEINSSYFEIERSSDGIRFLGIGKVKAKGNAAMQQDYQFADLFPAAGRNYYRLKQADIDGHSEYSYVVFVQNDSKQMGLITVFPNPVNSGSLKINLLVSLSDTYGIKIYDATGKLVITKSAYCLAGKNEIELNVSKLTRGTYSLRIDKENYTPAQLIIQ
ncbi:MAG: T9SS type A sorting domain-containing protein [Chitinophagaceae bacterium]|nr:T9SS type A sorting domain-containing protein [Chitinophagaceae bacterium]